MQYLSSSQIRRKLISEKSNLEPDIIVLVKGSSAKRSECPLGLVTKVTPCGDGTVCKIEVSLQMGRRQIPSQACFRIFRLDQL